MMKKLYLVTKTIETTFGILNESRVSRKHKRHFWLKLTLLWCRTITFSAVAATITQSELEVQCNTMFSAIRGFKICSKAQQSQLADNGVADNNRQPSVLQPSILSNKPSLREHLHWHKPPSAETLCITQREPPKFSYYNSKKMQNYEQKTMA